MGSRETHVKKMSAKYIRVGQSDYVQTDKTKFMYLLPQHNVQRPCSLLKIYIYFQIDL